MGIAQCDINADLSQQVPELPSDIGTVIHAAGKAHTVPRGTEESKAFFKVNLEGTKNLVYALEQAGKLPAFFVFISTVAVYGLEDGLGISEDTILQGDSPYARSKSEAEKWLSGWGREKGVEVLILRLPLMAGVNPPGNLGNMINALRKGFYFSIGHNTARRSMVLAEDVARLVFSLNPVSGIYNLTDGDHPSLNELETLFAQQLGVRVKNLPVSLAKLAATAGDYLSFLPVNTRKLEKLTQSLTFDDTKARRDLGWNPRPVLQNIDLILPSE